MAEAGQGDSSFGTSPPPAAAYETAPLLCRPAVPDHTRSVLFPYPQKSGAWPPQSRKPESGQGPFAA